MNEVKIFENEEFGLVRTAMIDGEPWFVGKDVALALGYAKPTDAARVNTDEEDRGVFEIQTPSGIQKMLIINESGLYSLILRSQLDSAKKFKRWVISEVLPSIRKNGGYISGQETLSDDELLEKALLVAQNKIKERERVITKQNELIAEMKPKEVYFDTICDARLLTNFRDAGKEIGMSQSQFTGWLKENGYIYATNVGELRPTEPYRASGLFQMKSYVNCNSGYSGIRTYLTPKGVQYFKMLFESHGIIPDALPKHGGRKKRQKA